MDGRRSCVDSGWLTVMCRQWMVDGHVSTVDGRQSCVDSGRPMGQVSIVDGGQLRIDGGQSCVNSGRWTIMCRQWTVDGHVSIVDG